VSWKPLLLTIGDPAGVGPELSIRGALWAHGQGIPVAIIGSAPLLQRVARQLSLPTLPTISIADESPAAVSLSAAGLSLGAASAVLPPIIDLPGLDANGVVPGSVSAATGRASLEYVEYAIRATLRGLAAGIVTGPIHKAAWHAAGIPFPGHTELLAERCHAPRHCMMLAAESIRCALVTVHVGLADVSRLLDIDGIYDTIRLAAAGVQQFIGRPPQITVCGLNPHAGEGGLFGYGEEERCIQPAIKRAREEGLSVRGPVPPDTAFVPALRSRTDVYICMYHDQGLIPLKALAFDDAVNITLGLPIVRTSVDHGTALDLAWKGLASDRSFRAAIDLAARLSSPHF